MSRAKEFALGTARMVVTAVVTTAFIVSLLAIIYSGSNKRQEEQNSQLGQVAVTLVSTNQAIACELALPVGPEGRDPNLVKACFTQYGLEPPTTLNP